MKNHNFFRDHKKQIQIILLILVLCFVAAVTYFVGKPMLQFVSDPEQFHTWVNQKGIWGILAFIGMVIFQVIMAVIPGGPFEIGAGYAFGIWKGSLICDLATTLGSILVFLFVRKFGMDFVEIFIKKEKIESVKFLKSSRKSESIVFLLFLIPGTPKDLLSYLVGLTDMKLSHWIFITFVGRFPAIFLSALSGSALKSKDYTIAVIATVVIIILYVIGLFVYQYHNKKRGAMKTINVKIKDMGSIQFVLWEDNAPKAINYVLKMVSLKKYDNKMIERFEPGFVLQPLFFDGLDDDIDKMVELEPNDNIKFERGIVAMAGTADAASGAQFFITLGRAKRLDGKFTIIGKVTDGFDTIEALEKLQVDEKVDEPSGFIYHQFKKDVIVESVRLKE